jgi:RNA polymerase sigma factor (sigma-70 family)
MAAHFETTNWSLIVRANALTTEVRRLALAELCEAYWYPMYAFARRRGFDHEDASDLAQAFFVHLIEKHALEGLSPAQGRFRAFLLASFKNFQSDARRRDRAQKRGGSQIRVPWDSAVLEARYESTVVADEDPEQHFVRQWALTLIERARERLRAQFLDARRGHVFDVLSPHLAAEQGEVSAKDLAQALETTEGGARIALYRFRRRFATALRDEVAATLDNPDEIESELRFLLAVLGDSGRPVSGVRAGHDRQP